MTITSKFKIGETIKIDGVSYEVIKRMAKMDLDSPNYPSISYDLKPSFNVLNDKEYIYGITENEIKENIRLAKWRADVMSVVYNEEETYAN